MAREVEPPEPGPKPSLFADDQPPARDQATLTQVTPRLPHVEDLTQFEIDAEVWRLTTLGWATWRVRLALGLEHISDVVDALERFREHSELTDTQKRYVMVGQLDEAIHRTMAILGHTHYKVYKGSLIMVPKDPHNPASLTDTKTYVPLVDDGPKLDAAKTLAVLLDRKAKLLGLDAPERHEHTVIPLPGVAQDWVAAKRAQVIEGTAS